MLVDNDRVVLRLKGELKKKRSWGTRELAELIIDLEVESTLDGDPPQRTAAADTDGPPEGAAPKGPSSSVPARTDPLDARGASHGNHAEDQEREVIHH